MSGVKTLRFTTDIDCSDCVNIVRNILDNTNSIEYWYLDILSSNHELTIMGKDIKVDELIRQINSEGFHMEKV